MQGGVQELMSLHGRPNAESSSGVLITDMKDAKVSSCL